MYNNNTTTTNTSIMSYQQRMQRLQHQARVAVPISAPSNNNNSNSNSDLLARLAQLEQRMDEQTAIIQQAFTKINILENTVAVLQQSGAPVISGMSKEEAKHATALGVNTIVLVIIHIM
ncbi:MAG: hypothetical protein EXX96DRAFT_539970 [Benjaminiella poitrasii]|nr:MAG: hypothetical protein EXX96DRAFT_539970 [Benjaminiella poitrasii]